MAHPDVRAFSAEIPVINDPNSAEQKQQMDQFQQAMNEYHAALNNHIEQLGQQLGVPSGFAADIWYLRTRSRWTQELEDRILKAYRDGHVGCPVNGDELTWLQERGY